MKVTVDSNTCRGCGFCIRMAGEVFVKKDGTVTAIEGDVPGHLEEHTEMALETCPEGSITINWG